jgi:hypothetical protein
VPPTNPPRVVAPPLDSYVASAKQCKCGFLKNKKLKKIKKIMSDFILKM